jgi:peptidoglycan/LPS O-acetylase OafA/YrhL
VTLLFCAIATIVFVPLTYWQQFLNELRASTAYVQNWQLAESAVDYFAADNGPSPVQHFWSLSAEEQFYVVWPVLLLLAVGLTRNRSVQVRRNAIIGVIATLTAVSLGYSLYDTVADPSAAYFITPTRAWEFGAGGLLALLPQIERSPGIARAVLSWAGILAILLAAFLFSEDTPFPGYAALVPVLGALAVIAAGTPSRRWAPTPVLELRPVQYVGNVSYSVYLWHWPLLIFAPFVVDRSLHPEAGVVILALTLLAAAVSKVLVEDPVRAGSFLTARGGRWTFAAAAAGTGVVLVVAAGAMSHMRGEIAAAERASQRILAAKPKCFGAAARDPRKPCSNPRLRYTVVPTPIAARKAPNHPCKVIERHDDIQICEFGVPKEEAKDAIAVIGDSHASHWRPSLDYLARKKGWHAYNVTHTSCPFSKGVRDIPEPTRSGCQRWKGDVLKWFSRHPEVTRVFAAQLSGGAGIRTSRRDKFAAEVDGYLKAWKTLPATVKRITVIRDTPKMRGDTDTCVQQAIGARRRAGVACALPRRSALDRDAAVAAAQRHPARVRYVNLTRYFCDSDTCFPVIGGALVYKDATHITSVYGRTLGPYLLRALG